MASIHRLIAHRYADSQPASWIMDCCLTRMSPREPWIITHHKSWAETYVEIATSVRLSVCQSRTCPPMHAGVIVCGGRTGSIPCRNAEGNVEGRCLAQCSESATVEIARSVCLTVFQSQVPPLQAGVIVCGGRIRSSTVMRRVTQRGVVWHNVPNLQQWFNAECCTRSRRL